MNRTEVGEAILRFDAQGGAVRISDIARIESGREDTGIIAHTNGQRGVTLLIQKRETADIVEAVEQVRTAVAAMDLPESVRVTLTNDESIIVNNRMALMFNNGLIGFVLVTAVLFTFVRPGPALWIIVGIPIVFLASLILFPDVRHDA